MSRLDLPGEGWTSRGAYAGAAVGLVVVLLPIWSAATVLTLAVVGAVVGFLAARAGGPERAARAALVRLLEWL